jgi:hypothetical protein
MRKRFPLRRLAPLALLLFLLVVLAPPVHALDWRVGENVVIAEDEVILDDLYANTTTFVMDGTIKGDLVVLGRRLTINGTVEGDLWVAGQVIIVNGAVDQDAHIAGMAIILGPDARVGEDLLVAGYGFESGAGSQVQESLAIAGMQATIDGTVGKDLYVSTNGLDLGAPVGGKAVFDLGSPEQNAPFNPTLFDPYTPSMPTLPGGLMLRDEASIGGDLEYTSPEPFDVDPAKVGGTIVHTPYGTTEKKISPASIVRNMTTGMLVRSVRRLIAWTLVGVLLASLLPKWVTRPASVLQARPWPSLGRGAAICLLFPVAVVLVVIAVGFVAISLRLLTLLNLASTAAWLGAAVVLAACVLFALAVTYLTRAVVGYWMGNLILSRVRPAWAEKPVWSTLLGVVILVLLTAIPIAGLLFGLATTCFGIGTLWLLWRETRGGQVIAEAIRTA